MATVYSIDHADNNVPSFIINPAQIDGFGGPKSNSSLTLHGTGRLKYGEAVNENFLHLLENFASPARAMPLITTIQAANNNGIVGTHTITFLDDKTDIFINGYEFQIVGSTSAINDNNYITNSSSYHSPSKLTTVIIQGSLPDDQAAFLGNVSFNVVEPEPNMIKPPYNQGQLWFNKTDGVLYVYKDISGSGIFQWDYSGRLGVTTEEPAFPSDGDLWYDPFTQQLKVYSGTSFISVADKYILKVGGSIKPLTSTAGFVGRSDGILQFESGNGTPQLFLNEGLGLITDGPDIRSANTMLLTASNSLHLNIDGDNTGYAQGVVISKGSHSTNGSTDLLYIYTDGRIQAGTINYETLVTHDSVLTNKKYVDDSILSISTGLSTTLNDYVLKIGDTISGDVHFAAQGPISNKLTWDSSSTDPTSIYVYEPAFDVSHLRIDLSDNADGTGNDKLDIGATVLNVWNSGTTISSEGIIVTANTVTSNVTVGSIVNTKHLTTKEYVDGEISTALSSVAGSGGGSIVHYNPTVAANGDIRVTGAGATLEIFIYGGSTWNKIFPAVYSN